MSHCLVGLPHPVSRGSVLHEGVCMSWDPLACTDMTVAFGRYLWPGRDLWLVCTRAEDSLCMHTDAVSLCRVPDTRTQHHLCTCTGIPCRDLWHICVCAECLKMALGKSWGEGLGVKHYWGEVSLYVNSFLSGIALISMCYKCATNEKNDRKRVNHFRLQQ